MTIRLYRSKYLTQNLTPSPRLGSTIGTVAQRRLLAFVLVLNLGQGVLFFATRGIRVDYGVAFQIFALMIFLLGFAKRFESIFVGLVKSDLEVKSQNKTLRQSRAVIEAALQEALSARDACERKP